MTDRPDIPFRRSTDLRVVGSIKGDVLVLRRRSSRSHLFRDKGAWGIDADELDNKRRYVMHIQLYDRDTGEMYRVSAFDFYRYCQVIHFEDHGRQYTLALNWWKVEQQDFQLPLVLE